MRPRWEGNPPLRHLRRLCPMRSPRPRRRQAHRWPQAGRALAPERCPGWASDRKSTLRLPVRDRWPSQSQGFPARPVGPSQRRLQLGREQLCRADEEEKPPRGQPPKPRKPRGWGEACGAETSCGEKLGAVAPEIPTIPLFDGGSTQLLREKGIEPWPKVAEGPKRAGFDRAETNEPRCQSPKTTPNDHHP